MMLSRRRLVSLVIIGVLAGGGGSIVGLQNAAGKVSHTGKTVHSSVAADGVRQSGTVVRVVDGDTAVVRIGGRNMRVRFLGVDTPESVKRGHPVECFAREASAFTKHNLEGRRVIVESDLSQDTYDRYGRLVGYVWVRNVLFNERIIREGYGFEYTYKGVPYRYQREFKEAEQDARIHSRGLWSTSTCAGQR